MLLLIMMMMGHHVSIPWACSLLGPKTCNASDMLLFGLGQRVTSAYNARNNEGGEVNVLNVQPRWIMNRVSNHYIFSGKTY